MNTFKKNGAVCGNGDGYCFNGFCPSLAQQCERIWDWMGTNKKLLGINIILQLKNKW